MPTVLLVFAFVGGLYMPLYISCTLLQSCLLVEYVAFLLS